MLAALWSMEKFEYFLKGREFKLITDHIALKALNSKAEIKTARIVRWMEILQQFNFKVEYKPGDSIPHVDGLSRLVKEDNVNLISDNVSNREKERIMEIHYDLVHRGDKVTAAEYNKKYQDKINEEECRKVIGVCISCKCTSLLESIDLVILEHMRWERRFRLTS
ncbi:Transposon Tf2-9 polyprotein [Nosema granulosis]|uniref:Transposon Tf2-9 polyprotein n=1 Tax=Nosema granulosis TaxID=83296 RepID=A0A9P6GW61_9MICR|nr:Transposon Tf2-9 polyprotein [Nosema granulosis]